VNRLYQWLLQWVRPSGAALREGQGPRIVRTRVTVEEQQRTVLLSVSSGAGVCPLCGHALSELPQDVAGVITLEHSQIHARRPEGQLGDGQAEQGKNPRLGKPGGSTRRLR
jgi:hypothetical protein